MLERDKRSPAPLRVCARVRARALAMSAEKTDRAARIAVIEKTCTNPETRTSPLCDTYDRLRKEFPNEGRQSPYTSEWQRIRVMSGLTRSGASAAWEQLLAHPPSAPLKHVDHSHRLEGAATAGCQGNWFTSCKSYWTEQMKTANGRRMAQERYNELSELMRILSDKDRKQYEPEWLDLACLLQNECSSKATKASVFDALEARVEGLYEEHEEAGTEIKYKQVSEEYHLGCHDGYYQVKRVKEGKRSHSKTHYTLYVSSARVRQYFTNKNEPFDVYVTPVDKQSKKYHIQLPTKEGAFVTLSVYSQSGESLVQVRPHEGKYPQGKIPEDLKFIKEYYACAARAVWARMHPHLERSAGFKDGKLEIFLEENKKELSGTRDS